jgi:hypothetical protein
MDAQRIIGILLIAAGALALTYGSFTYTKDTHSADVGPVHMSIDEKETVNIPKWAGAGAVAVGAILMLVRRKR